MSKWTHCICGKCWTLHYGDTSTVHMRHADDDLCCWCGNVTNEGIYVRHDPKELLCRGIHSDVEGLQSE